MFRLDAGGRGDSLTIRGIRVSIFKQEFAQPGALLELHVRDFEAEPLGARVAHQHVRTDRVTPGANSQRSQGAWLELLFSGRNPTAEAQSTDLKSAQIPSDCGHGRHGPYQPHPWIPAASKPLRARLGIQG